MGKLDFPQGLKPNVYKVLSDTAEEAAEKVRKADSSWAEAHSE